MDIRTLHQWTKNGIDEIAFTTFPTHNVVQPTFCSYNLVHNVVQPTATARLKLCYSHPNLTKLQLQLRYPYLRYSYVKNK